MRCPNCATPIDPEEVTNPLHVECGVCRWTFPAVSADFDGDYSARPWYADDEGDGA